MLPKRAIAYLASVVFWILLWYFAAKSIDLELILPSPKDVIIRLFELIATAEFHKTVLSSLLRILSGITAGFILGFIFAIITVAFPPLEALFSPLLSTVKATPVASFIMLALLWINGDALPAFITLLIVFPLAWANVSEGIRSAPKQLLEIASVHKMSAFGKLLYVYLPSLIPFLASTAKSALGLAWKAGIAAEVLAVPKNAIGGEIYSSKVFLETTDLFVWTLVTVILSICMEASANALLSRLTHSYGFGKKENENGN